MSVFAPSAWPRGAAALSLTACGINSVPAAEENAKAKG